MPVLVEGLSVIVRRSSVNEVYPGGWDQFVRDVPNRTLCMDADVVRVGFMDPRDVQAYVESLVRKGLRYREGDRVVDIAVVDQVSGPTVKCDWLEVGPLRMPFGTIAACRLVGSAEQNLVCPGGWKYEGSLSQKFGFVPTAAEKQALEFLRHENGIDVFRDRQTGREVFIGRTSSEG